MVSNKYIKLSIITFLLGLLCTSCHIFSYDSFSTSSESWEIKNCTNDTLNYILYKGSNINYNLSCEKDLKTKFIGRSTKLKEPLIKHDFNYMINTCQYDSIVIKVKNKVVKIWRMSEANHPGKQFFKESSWQKLKTNEARCYWTFEIHPEDLDLSDK